MSVETAQDPRTAMARTKYFSLHPKPLERWLWRHGLPQSAERVFWLHWEEGMRQGDWCSELPIKRVARECCVDPSTVTRAYQVLKALGLIRREDPGRQAANPFQQATAITEVRLPSSLLGEMGRHPNRTPVGMSSTVPAAGQVAPIGAAQPRESQDQPPDPAPAPSPRLSRQEIAALWGRASAAERTRFHQASQNRLLDFACDPDTALTTADRGYLAGLLRAQARARPHIQAPRQTPHPPLSTARRRLTPLEIARVHKGLVAHGRAADAARVLHEILWSVEEGALRRFAIPLAVNIALKKAREGLWVRPHRMPCARPLSSLGDSSAAPGQCIAA